MIGPPEIERAMERAFVVEVAITAVDGEPRGRNGRQERSRRDPHYLFSRARSDDDQLVAKARGGLQLRIHIGAHPAPRRRVESADIHNSHQPSKAES